MEVKGELPDRMVRFEYYEVDGVRILGEKREAKVFFTRSIEVRDVEEVGYDDIIGNGVNNDKSPECNLVYLTGGRRRVLGTSAEVLKKLGWNK